MANTKQTQWHIWSFLSHNVLSGLWLLFTFLFFTLQVLCIFIKALVLCFYGIRECAYECISASISVSRGFSWALLRVFILSYSDFFVFVLFSFIYYPLDASFFLWRKDKRMMDPVGRGDGEELWGIKRGEALVRIYWIETSLFSIKKNNEVN